MSPLDLPDTALFDFVRRLRERAGRILNARLRWVVYGKHDDVTDERAEEHAFLDELLPELEEAVELWAMKKTTEGTP